MISVDDFYQQLVTASDNDLWTLLPSSIHKEIGHVNVFDVAELMRQFKHKPVLPYLFIIADQEDVVIPKSE